MQEFDLNEGIVSTTKAKAPKATTSPDKKEVAKTISKAGGVSGTDARQSLASQEYA